MRVLIVEDNPKLGSILVRGLATDSICADLVTTGHDALQRTALTKYAAIVLDVMLPDTDGFSVCRRIRDDDVETPIIFLTARDAVEDRVHGLQLGADDYLVKPFALKELMARVRAVSRRGPARHSVTLSCGDLLLDASLHQARRGDTAIDLSRKEFAVLEALMREPGRVLSRYDLLEEAWDGRQEDRSNVVEVYVRYLREKIDRPFGRESLQTIRGVGYRIVDDA
jgi:two-component system OmpR family response regulator